MKRERVLAGIVLIVIGLSSCVKEDLNGARGKVAVNFTLGDAAYGEEESVVRSAARQGMESETVMLPAAGDLKMYATLEEEDRPPLRDLETIAEGTKVRIVAYDSDGDYVANNEYVIGPGGSLASATTLEVPAPDTYTFVAYSLNTADALPYLATLGPYLAGAADVLWGEAPDEYIDEDESVNNVTIKMFHQFSRVRLEVSSSELGHEIEALGDVFVAGYQANLVVKEGLVKDVAEEQTLARQTDFPATTISYARREVFTGGEATTAVRITSATINGATLNFPVPVRFNRKLEAGKSYALKVSFKTLRWAKSNIYWKWKDDGDPSKGGEMTFVSADDSDESKQGYQGVFFRWGSLVGISPAQTEIPESGGTMTDDFLYSATTIYVPYDYPAAPKWRATKAATEGWSTWTSCVIDEAAPTTDIPYLDGSYAGTGTIYDRYNTFMIDAEQNTTAKYQELRGDICQYLSAKTGAVAGNYRMPVSYEYGQDGSVIYSWTGRSDGWTPPLSMNFPAQTLSVEDGTANIIGDGADQSFAKNTLMGNVLLPVSGYRRHDSGLLNLVGERVLYWSASPLGRDIPSMDFSVSFMRTNAGHYRSYGVPVRCVKN